MMLLHGSGDLSYRRHDYDSMKPPSNALSRVPPAFTIAETPGEFGMRFRRAIVFATLLHAPGAIAQGRGATRLHELVAGLTVTPRVLLIGAEPGDADADLIAWLAREHHVQTAYLSLTRGESTPNYTGAETGAAVGAVHVREALSARAIDGAEQYFTHAFDFGSARNATDVFRQLEHTRLLGDIVVVVRAFRPQVIVARFADDTTAHDGKRQASAILAREVFDAALDTVAYGVAGYGLPWAPSALYGPGTGLMIDANDLDRMIGATYAGLATQSRSELRSSGFDASPWEGNGIVHLRQIATRNPDHRGTTSLFDGVDTTFARLGAAVPADLGRLLPLIAAYADSARTQLDVQHPAGIVGHLSRTTELVNAARNLVHGCRHPSPHAALTIVSYRPCAAALLDVDASLDLMLQRTSDALTIAAGVSVEAVADREFIATRDTALVKITVSNHGDSRVRVNDVSVTGGVAVRMDQAIDVPAHGSTTIERRMTFLTDAHPWWLWKREDGFFPYSSVALDGVARADVVPKHFAIDDIAIPEGMRSLSEAAVTLTIGMTTISASTRPIVYRSADPVLGARDRAISGVPPVTIGFERTIEWAQAGKPLRKPVRLILRSYSDRARTFALAPPRVGGVVRFDSLPRSVTLNPHDVREVSVIVRGSPEQLRYELNVAGVAPGERFGSGFRTAQYSYLTPLHFFRQSTLQVQGVNVEIPKRLTVAYVRGVGDDIDNALKQLGIPAYTLNAEGLLRFGLDGVSSLVFGPDAFRVDPNLAGMSDRFAEFVRKGGTIVMLSNPVALSLPGIVPYPLALAAPYPDKVAMSTAPVTPLTAGDRLLSWPNRIVPADWSDWVGDRATFIPSTVDPRYARVLEMHDPEEPPSRSALLVATVGKGRFIYTSMTFGPQIANGVPGAMRLLINLLSAGLPVER